MGVLIKQAQASSSVPAGEDTMSMKQKLHSRHSDSVRSKAILLLEIPDSGTGTRAQFISCFIFIFQIFILCLIFMFACLSLCMLSICGARRKCWMC